MGLMKRLLLLFLLFPALCLAGSHSVQITFVESGSTTLVSQLVQDSSVDMASYAGAAEFVLGSNMTETTMTVQVYFTNTPSGCELRLDDDADMSSEYIDSQTVSSHVTGWNEVTFSSGQLNSGTYHWAINCTTGLLGRADTDVYTSGYYYYETSGDWLFDTTSARDWTYKVLEP